MKIFILASAVALSASVAAIAAPHEPPPQQASIPFVNHGGIYNWEAVDRDTIYVQDRRRQWYRADLLGPCLGLNFATRVGFAGGPTDTFDRFAYVLVARQRCPVESLSRSGPPPKRDRHKLS
ncbi:DUF6491 family protein [Sphingomonas crusticola]|uniref:DUF6491 family protein n=1 Tax=Sphingomonas crusticola TaxID=1697973 RepID=UPI000E22EF0E|nr:DUF6491 family protein [Sphingomonas crusticola]